MKLPSRDRASRARFGEGSARAWGARGEVTVRKPRQAGFLEAWRVDVPRARTIGRVVVVDAPPALLAMAAGLEAGFSAWVARDAPPGARADVASMAAGSVVTLKRGGGVTDWDGPATLYFSAPRWVSMLRQDGGVERRVVLEALRVVAAG